MLRRKLLLILGGLTAVLVLLAVGALWPLQNLFAQVEHLSTEGGEILDQSTKLSGTINAIELELYRLQSGQINALDHLINQVGELEGVIEAIGAHYVVAEPYVRPIYERMQQRLETFKQRVSTLATVQDPELAEIHKTRSLDAAAELRADILEIGRLVHGHVQEEQLGVAAEFRWLVIGIGVAFLLAIDLAVLLLLHATSLVLRPVEKLVEGSRRLAKGDFAYRAELDQRDEFGELAQAFNHLASELQAQEEQRIQTLQQVGLTLNHELNNAMSVIEMQLQLVRRDTDGQERVAQRIRDIQDGLKRMAGVVESLKHIQRIVLTDYREGLKMLDLEQSTQVHADIGAVESR